MGLFSDIAGAIRVALGTTDSIKADDFPSKILEISSGGSNDDRGLIDRSISIAEDSTITTIGVYAFANCSQLTTVSFPNCATVAYGAFMNCTNLSNINFSSCTTIGSSAFRGCTSLSTISFPNCTTIRASAFYGCTSLSTASFPNCTTIEYNAFRDCTSLSTLYLMSSSVVSLYSTNAFSGVGWLQSIYVPMSLLSSYQATNWSQVGNLIGIS